MNKLTKLLEKKINLENRLKDLNINLKNDIEQYIIPHETFLLNIKIENNKKQIEKLVRKNSNK